MRPPSRRTLLIGLVVLLAGAFLVGGLVKTRVQTGLDSFLPTDDPAVTDLNTVATQFGGDPIVVLLESEKPRALLGDEQIQPLVQLEGQLASLPDVATVYGPGTLLNQIAGRAQDLLAELTGRRDGLASRAEASARQAGGSPAEVAEARAQAVAGFDERYGPLIVQGLPAGLPTLRNQSFVSTVIFTPSGPRPQWRFVVPADNAVAILVRPREGADAAAVGRLVASVRETVGTANLGANRVTVSGVPAVVAALNTQAGREGPLLGGLAVAAVGLVFFLVPWTRRSRRLVPLGTTLAAIGLTLAVFGWLGRPLSIGVVAFLSVVLGIGCYYPTYFAVRARVRTVLTVACATAASFATLALSPLPLVRDLGMTLSLGVLLSALLGIMARGLIRGAEPSTEVARPPDDGPGDADGPETDAGTAVPDDERSTLLGRLRGRPRPAAAVLVGVVLAAFGWAALPGLPLQTDVEGFAAGLPALSDAEHVEQVLGSSGELDVVLSGPDVLSPEAIRWMQAAESEIVLRYGDRARRVISPPMLLAFLGNGASPEQIDAAVRILPPYLTGAVVSLSRGTALMVYGVRVDDFPGIQQLRSDLLGQLPPPPEGYDVKLVGLPVVAARGQELVSGDRYLANLVGVVVAGMVLVIGLRRRQDAARAVVAALLATGVGLFLLWLTGTALSPITVALGSLTTAVGCEFTVLLSEAARRRIPELRRAVQLVTATSVIGYGVLVVSGIAVVREFGVLLAGAVLLALLSSMCVVWLSTGGAARGVRAGRPGDDVLWGVRG